MSRSLAFALVLVMVALGITNIVLLEHRPMNAGLPLAHADYRACTTIRTGPIHRPDNYSTRPHGRKADIA